MDPMWFAESGGYAYPEFFIDGESLIEILIASARDRELVDAFYFYNSGMLQAESGKRKWEGFEQQYLEIYRLNLNPQDGPDGIGQAALYGCRCCRDLACGAIVASISSCGDSIFWHDFRKRDSEHAGDELGGIPDLRFERAQYLDALSGVESMLRELPEFMQQAGSPAAIANLERFKTKFGPWQYDSRHETDFDNV